MMWREREGRRVAYIVATIREGHAKSTFVNFITRACSPSLVPYSPRCLVGAFLEVRLLGVVGSSPKKCPNLTPLGDVLAPVEELRCLMRPLRTQLWRAPHFACGGVGSTPAVRSNIGPGSCWASAFLRAYRSKMCRSADVLSPHAAVGSLIIPLGVGV
jgi:hypothetical protein